MPKRQRDPIAVYLEEAATRARDVLPFLGDMPIVVPKTEHPDPSAIQQLVKGFDDARKSSYQIPQLAGLLASGIKDRFRYANKAGVSPEVSDLFLREASGNAVVLAMYRPHLHRIELRQHTAREPVVERFFDELSSGDVKQRLPNSIDQFIAFCNDAWTKLEEIEHRREERLAAIASGSKTWSSRVGKYLASNLSAVFWGGLAGLVSGSIGSKIVGVILRKFGIDPNP